MFTMIAAIGKNRELGKQNELIWHLPGDLQFFKMQTNGKKIVMGRKTYASLPKRLENREYYVVTRKQEAIPDVHVITNLDAYISQHRYDREEIFVIGGAEIYEQFLPFCQRMLLTEIEAEEKKADVWFPVWDKKDWERTVLQKREEHGIVYRHSKYERKER